MAGSGNNLHPKCYLPRRQSSGLLESAETLVDNLDSLADILDDISNKYETVSIISI